MLLRLVLVSGLLLFIAAGCKKDEQKPVIVKPVPTDSLDLGIVYSTYSRGQFYTSDTFQTRFTVTNYGPSPLKSGDTLYAAVKISQVVYALNLIGSGPTKILLPGDLPVNGTFEYNPGYLLRTPSLNFYATDTLDITLLLYGSNGSPIDPSFPRDPSPQNNKATLRLTRQNHFIAD